MIKKHDIKHGTDAWHSFRANGIGGSEAATVMNLNPYGSAMVLWAEKCGYSQPDKRDNEAMFHGRNLEGYVASLWEGWDWSTGGYMDGYGKGIRRCSNPGCYFVNDEYPWLFASPDRIINPGEHDSDGVVLDDGGILECKTISGMSAAAWDNGVPMHYLIQCYTYMVVLGLDYAEIAILEDGRKFNVFPLRMNEVITNAIISSTRDFWYGKVLPARELVESMTGANHGEVEPMVWAYQPEPDGGDACRRFMSDKFKSVKAEERGSVELYGLCVDYKEVSGKIKELSSKKDLVSSKIENAFVLSGADRFTFGDDGYVSYFMKKGASKRQLNVRLK
jgi:putative phage-type endonuclease